jgi:hypothetical protein
LIKITLSITLDGVIKPHILLVELQFHDPLFSPAPRAGERIIGQQYIYLEWRKCQNITRYSQNITALSMRNMDIGSLYTDRLCGLVVRVSGY